jgi:chorismate dehydratase
VRFDVPSRCAELLHEGHIDVGLIPSIEYGRGPVSYRIVPDLAIASCGPVVSVALYTTRPMPDVRSIALDTSSRASVALVRVLCARWFRIEPSLEMRGPDIAEMLEHCDAALLIGDNALLTSHPHILTSSDPHILTSSDPHILTSSHPQMNVTQRDPSAVQKIDLGEAWTAMTGLPFVWAFWAGRADALTAADVTALQRARDAGIAKPVDIAREYFRAPHEQTLGARYLRDNIKYHLGGPERAGLERFYRYASEIGVVLNVGPLRFY